MLRVAIAALTAMLTCTTPAVAAFHLMKVAEVYAGSPAAPSAQYVILQMYATGQQFVSGHSVTVYNAAGIAIQTFTFPGNVGNGANQAKIMLGTTQAAAFFGVTPDLTMTASIPPGGGKVCFDGIDCMTWGNYSGPGPVGTPFNSAGVPDCFVVGIPPGKAAKRRLDIFGSPTVLDAGDDTENSANDFVLGTPAPRNNANTNGTIPAATCGNGVLEGLEECDDNNTASDDGCSSTCLIECAVVGVPVAPLEGRLMASPTPFRDQVAILFTLPADADADIGVFDLGGRRVRALHRGMLTAGPHRIVWDGVDDRGQTARAGLYFVRLRAGDLDLRTAVVRSR